MTRLRSAPRRTYRIYSEEEFLAAEDVRVEAGIGAGSASELEPEFALLGPAGPRHKPKRWGGLAALVALTSVVAAVVGVVALNATRSKPRIDRGIAARGGSPPEIVADRPSMRPLDAHPRKRLRRTSMAVRRVVEHRLFSAGRLSAHRYHPPWPTLPPRPTRPTATASAPATPATPTIPATPATSATPATPPAPVAAAPTTAATTAATTAVTTETATATAGTPVASATAVTPAARGAGAEFGFER